MSEGTYGGRLPSLQQLLDRAENPYVRELVSNLPQKQLEKVMNDQAVAPELLTLDLLIGYGAMPLRDVELFWGMSHAIDNESHTRYGAAAVAADFAYNLTEHIRKVNNGR